MINFLPVVTLAILRRSIISASKPETQFLADNVVFKERELFRHCYQKTSAVIVYNGYPYLDSSVRRKTAGWTVFPAY